MTDGMDHYFGPQNIVDYVTTEKRRVTISGAEPYFLEGSSGTAVLLLHGWCASAESVRFLASGLSAAGHAVLAPTLPGHGASSHDMLAVGPVEWSQAAHNAARTLRQHFQSVVVMGVSMGGALAIQLAAAFPDLIGGIVTINAPVFMKNASLARDIVSAPADQYLLGWTKPDFFCDPVDEISYSERFKKSGADLYSVCGLARDMLPLITCPILVVQSLLDPIVHPSSADEILERSAASFKQILWLEQSYHASQLDLDRDRIVLAAVDFIKEQIRV